MNHFYQPTLTLKRMFFVEQAAQGQQHYRPFDTTFNSEIELELQNISSRVMDGSGSLSAPALNGVANKLFTPRVQSSGQLDIANGWQERRFAVYMLIEVSRPTGKAYEMLTGFTDKVDASHNGFLDPGMFIWFNGFMPYEIMATQTAMGIENHATSDRKLSQVLNPIALAGHGQVDGVGMRPQDTLLTMGQGSLTMYDANVVDSRTSLNNKVCMSKTGNVRSGQFLSGVLNSYNMAMNDDDCGYGSEDFTCNHAAENLREATHTNSQFLTEMDRRCGYATTRTVTLGDVQQLWPDYNDGTYAIQFLGNGEIVDMAQHSMDWGMSTIETKIAYTLTHLVPTILGDFFISGFSFEMSNQNMTNSPALAPTSDPISMFSEVPINPMKMMALERVLIDEIMAACVVPNCTLFTINVSCNLMGNVDINLSIDGKEWCVFSAPAFCNSITTPVVGVSQDQLNNVASDLRLAIDSTFQPAIHLAGQFQM